MKEFLVTISDINLLSVSGDITDVVRKRLQRAKRKGVSHQWKHNENKEDERRKVIDYFSIPKDFLVKYRLPDPSTAPAILEAKKSRLEAISPLVKEGKTVTWMQSFTVGRYLNYISKYADEYGNDIDKVKCYASEEALREAVVQCCNAKSFTKKQCHEAYMALSKIEQYRKNGTVRNYTKFVVYVNGKWQTPEGRCLIHGHTGRKRPELSKLTDAHIGIIEQYAMHPNMYTHQAITEISNVEFQRLGLNTLERRRVSAYLSQPEVKNRLSYYRNPEYFDDHVRPTSRREAALNGGDLYYMDGTPLQIPCLSRDGKRVVRLTLFAVIDQHSKKIVGFALAESEDRLVWLSAMKMAIDLNAFAPAEWVYDNASATLTEEFKQVKDRLFLMGCNMHPAPKGRPTYKADIERFFDTFQNFQRLVEGFIGGGIRDKRETARIDPAFLQKLKKGNGHFTFDSLVEITTYLVAIYNQKASEKKPSPSAKFEASQKPNVIAVTPEKLATLFWKHKTIKVLKGEIATRIRHTEYYYEVYDHALALRLNGTKVKMYYDETDLSNVHLFSLEDEYLTELRQKVSFHAAQVNQDEHDVQNIIKQSAHNKAIETVVKQQTKEVAKKAEAIIGDTLYNLANPYQTYKDTYNTAETEALLNYVRDNSNIDQQNVKEYAPMTAKEERQSIQDRYKKKFQDDNPTLDIVGQM